MNSPFFPAGMWQPSNKPDAATLRRFCCALLPASFSLALSNTDKSGAIMAIKRITISLGILLCVSMALTSSAGGNDSANGPMKHHNMMDHTHDGRISLGLSPQMKARQLANMRSHVEAVQTIIGLIGNGDFNGASEIAHSRLGLTEDMRKMCNMFENDDFRNLGLQFHESADALGDILKTRDINRSLGALHATMAYCVRCHAAFRQ